MGAELEKIISMRNYEKEKLLNKANQAIYDNDLDKAMELFKEAMNKYPTDPNIMYNLAGLYLSKGKTYESEKLMEEALKYDPDHLYSLIGLANIIYYKTEDFSKAKNYLDLALKKNKDSHELYASYANLYLLEGNLTQAAEYYLKSINLDNEYEIAQKGLSTTYNHMGIKLVKKHKFDKALFYFKQSINFNEEWLLPRLNMARCFGFLKKYEKAFELIMEIQGILGHIAITEQLKKEDDKGFVNTILMIHLTQAKLLYEMAEKKKAKDLLLKIYDINPILPTLNYSLALIFLEENNLENARKHIKKRNGYNLRLNKSESFKIHNL